MKLDPVSALRSHVQQQARRTIVVGHQNVDSTVVVHIAEHRRPADLDQRQRRAGRGRYILKTVTFA
jgi:hypothetical protein